MSQNYEKLIQPDGNILFKRGKEILPVPSEEACRERLIQLLETTSNDQERVPFWVSRASAIADPDPMKGEWAGLVYERLSDAWDKLHAPGQHTAKQDAELDAMFADCEATLPEPDIFDVFKIFGTNEEQQEKLEIEPLTEEEKKFFDAIGVNHPEYEPAGTPFPCGLCGWDCNCQGSCKVAPCRSCGASSAFKTIESYERRLCYACVKVARAASPSSVNETAGQEETDIFSAMGIA